MQEKTGLFVNTDGTLERVRVLRDGGRWLTQLGGGLTRTGETCGVMGWGEQDGTVAVYVTQYGCEYLINEEY